MAQVLTSVQRNTYTMAPGATFLAGSLGPPTGGCTFVSATTLQISGGLIPAVPNAGIPAQTQYVVDTISYWLALP
jgi:hypothetical protein